MYLLDEFKELIRKNHDDENSFTDYEECKRCATSKKPTCCELCPCELSPSDLIQVTKENILKLLDTGFVVLDCWDGDLQEFGFDEYHKVWFLRMRSIDERGGVNFGYGGRCAYLNDGIGCILEFKYRPYYGRTTLPCSKVKEWDRYSTKLRSCKEWRPYHNLLEEIAIQLEPKLINSRFIGRKR